jgi:hypothetical protein
MKHPSQSRATAELSKSLNHRLNMYVLAAGASGVGLLALAPRADAKIIYTPAHAKVSHGFFLPIDLNHDGVVDFYLNSGGHSSVAELSGCQYMTQTILGSACSYDFRGTNAVRTIDSKGAEYAAALRSGDKVQRGRFAKSKAILGIIFRTDFYGPWFNGGKGVKNRYLGLKFKIKGRFHFGWARLTVTRSPLSITATLTGYAYETIPGKGIVAGQTKGPNVITLDPANLGRLAAGASATPAWRIKHTSATTH